MALFTQKEDVKCSCGNDTFTDCEVFRIEKKPIKSTLTNTIVLEKKIIDRGIKCTACGNVMHNPLPENKEA